MPKVPVVTERTVEPTALRPNYISPETPEGAFGEGYVRAGREAGAAITQYGNVLAQQRDIADNARVNLVTADYNRAAGAIVDEAYRTSGEGALGITDKTTAELEELSQRTAQSLNSDRQRDKFIPHSLNVMAGYHASVSRHEGQESDRLAKVAAVSRTETAYTRAAQNWNQPEIVGGAMLEVDAAIASEAARNGWTAEVADAARFEARSGLYSTILKAQSSQNDHAAFLKTYDAVKDKLTAKDLATFSPVATTTAEEAVVYSTSDAIFNEYTKFDANGRLVYMNESAIYRAANAAPSGIREDVVKQAESRVAQANQADRNYKSNVVQGAWESYARGGGRIEAIPMAQRSELQRVSGDVYQRMKEDQVRRVKGEPEVFDFAAYGRYESLLPDYRLKPGNTALESLFGRVPDHVLKEKIDEETVIRAQQMGLRTSGAEIRGPSLDTDTVKGMISTSILENDGLFYGSGNSQTEVNTMKGQFTRRVQDGVFEFSKVNGRKPDREDTQKIINDALIEGSRKNKSWHRRDSGFRAFQLPPGEFTPDNPTEPATSAAPEEAKPVEMPASERHAIISFLKSRGVEVTEETVQKQYAHNHRFDGVKP